MVQNPYASETGLTITYKNDSPQFAAHGIPFNGCNILSQEKDADLARVVSIGRSERSHRWWGVGLVGFVCLCERSECDASERDVTDSSATNSAGPDVVSIKTTIYGALCEVTSTQGPNK